MSAVEELTQICAALPAEKVAEVIDFALFLQTRAAAPAEDAWRPEPEGPGDAEWERILSEKVPRPKFLAFAEKALAEGPSELLTDEAFAKHMKP